MKNKKDIKIFKGTDIRDIKNGVGLNWHENVRCLGYWEKGKSLIFSKETTVFCVTKRFLEETIEKYKNV